jgi:ATP-dependent DNA ligase
VNLPISIDFAPMEATLVREIPQGEGWTYEPKWDGFRCLAFRDGDRIDLRSKSGKPLARYFPDVVEIIRSVAAPRFVLDGELVVAVDGALVFDELLKRIHPAASRVRKLAEERPASLIVFDQLVDAGGNALVDRPLSERLAVLDTFMSKYCDHPALHQSPRSTRLDVAGRWFTGDFGGLDGVMAKRMDEPYRSGDRTAMSKVKRLRTAECVVGGFRWTRDGSAVASMLLGVYDTDELLHHVGFCSAMNARLREEVGERLIPLRGGDGFSGRAPGGPSRWRREGSADWEPVRLEVVIEVEYDHFSGGRFRHGTRFLRWRPDKAPRQCRMEQIEQEAASAMGMLKHLDHNL